MLLELYTSEYDEFVDDSCRFKDNVYPVLGLAGETGETVEGIKKLWRKYGDRWVDDCTEEERQHIIEELGDIAWYITGIAHRLGSNLDNVLDANHKKLIDRQKNGKK